jgi:hypothetical protein
MCYLTLPYSLIHPTPYLHLTPHRTSIQVIMSRNPLPTISFAPHNSEWFDSLVHKLHWNVRAMQKPLPSNSAAAAAAAASSSSVNDPFHEYS